MTYTVYMKGGPEIDITEEQFKHLTSESHSKDKKFIVYDENDNISGVIYIHSISLIKVKDN